jgi:hypothetical protein
MLRSFLWVGFLTALTGCPPCALYAQDQTAWQEAQLKKLSGRWTTIREEKTAPDKTRRRRVDLEFADGKLKVFISGEIASKQPTGELRVLGVVKVPEVIGDGNYGWLNLGGNASQKVAVYYDFVGEKLVLIGRIGWRPWEGFRVSGEYQRAETPK